MGLVLPQTVTGDTHGGSLSGDAALNAASAAGSANPAATDLTATIDGTVGQVAADLVTVSPTIPANTKAVIVYATIVSVPAANGSIVVGDAEIRAAGATMANQVKNVDAETLGISPARYWTARAVEFDVTAGARSYVARLLTTRDIGYTRVYVVIITDTHAAGLTGSSGTCQ